MPNCWFETCVYLLAFGPPYNPHPAYQRGLCIVVKIEAMSTLAGCLVMG